MNSPDPLEQRLARTPFRQAPPSLRRQVLQGLAAAPPTSPGIPDRIRARIAGWLWPHPVAWGALGLAWIVVGWLSLASIDARPGVPPQQLERRILPAWTAMLREQRALLNSLLEDPPPPALPEGRAPGAQLWRDKDLPWLSLV